jgi:hypothetical protein
MNCPLCNHNGNNLFHTDKHRSYYRCHNCRLVFVPAEQRLSAAEEKAAYDLHQNSPDDPGYRRFLSRLFEPLCERVAPAAKGLDFGSGPGPTLSVMFTETGFDMTIYDLYYADYPERLTRQYDFITSTEVVEHLFEPGEVFQLLFSRLKPNGWLGMMTKLVIDQPAFATWHYKNDPTHVCFYSRDTFHWLAESYGCKVDFIGNDVILMQKH